MMLSVVAHVVPNILETAALWKLEMNQRDGKTNVNTKVQFISYRKYI